MLVPKLQVEFGLLCLAHTIRGQSAGGAERVTFGDNDLSISLDNEAVSRNYQDVDIQLLSPAFTDPGSVPAGFSNGTSGPTPDHVLGEMKLLTT